jgi:hypothetical protein
LKSTTATPRIAAPLGPDIDPDALLVPVDTRFKVGGLVTLTPAADVELENREADEEEGRLDRQGSSSRLVGEVYWLEDENEFDGDVLLSTLSCFKVGVNGSSSRSSSSYVSFAVDILIGDCCMMYCIVGQVKKVTDGSK